jgi:hypothetical protein
VREPSPLDAEALRLVELLKGSLERLRRPAGPPPPYVGRVHALQPKHAGFAIKTPDPRVRRPALQRGWLWKTLLAYESVCWGRWAYWFCTARCEALLPDPIPEIDFADHCRDGGWARTREMVEACLRTVDSGWSGSADPRAWEYFLDWLLYAIGGAEHLPIEPNAGASSRLYQVFNVDALVLYPYDYFGDLLAESAYGRRHAFYPTPMTVVKMMLEIGRDEPAGSADRPDPRAQTVLDPCVGTGRFLLLASNASLRLYGQDIDPLVVKASVVNAALYAPWMYRPIPWLQDWPEGEPVPMLKAYPEWRSEGVQNDAT